MDDIAYLNKINEEAQVNFNLFKKEIEEKGFFLGICDWDNASHLILSLADPKIKKRQVISFVFPFSPAKSSNRLSITPKGTYDKKVKPVAGNEMLHMQVKDALEYFKRAAETFKPPLCCPLDFF